MRKRIAVIGAGRVGQALARGWRAAGHRMTLGVRDPAAPEKRRAASALGASLLGVADAARDAEIVVLATPWSETERAIAAAGDLAGKIVIDCTNPLTPSNRGLALGFTQSGGERVAAWARGADVVKTLNTIDSSHMASPDFAAGAPTMFLCGDDARAKATVTKLLGELGFEPVDVGALKSARLLEPMALLLIGLIYEQGLGPDIAFKLLRRGDAGAAHPGG